ncbi:hypothetical protein N2152v2_005238 [Parachlorella kessleri]
MFLKAALAGIGTRLARGWDKMTPQQQLLFGGYILTVLAHMAWRWVLPSTYCRWRHFTTTALTLFATCAPWFWRRRVAGLARHPPSPGSSSGLLQSAKVATRVALVSSYTLQLTVYGMGRPAPAWLKLPAHLASTSVAVSHVSAMCRTAEFTQPAAAFWFGRTYRALQMLALMLPLPASPLLPGPTEEQACGAVVTMIHVSLGCIIPMLMAVAAEARARRQHALLHRQHLEAWRRQKRRLWWQLAEWLGAGGRLFDSWAANAGAAVVVTACVWDVIVGLRATGADAGVRLGG